MENHFIPLQSLAQQLADQLNGLYSGKNKKESLEQMVNNSRELYERLIVLRHKAYEQEVQPTPTESIEVEMPVFTLDLEESVNDVPAMEPETSIAFEPEVEAQEEISSIEITPEIEVDTRQVNLMDMIEEVIQEKTTPPAEDNTPII